jgi:hypothetical protein
MPDVMHRVDYFRGVDHEGCRTFLAGLSSEERLALAWGYALTDKGIKVGLEHEPDLDEVTVLRALKALQHRPDCWEVAPMIEVLDGLISAAEARLAA